MKSTLEQHFTELIKNYDIEANQLARLWNEIETAYSKSSRYYHTLQHLENLLHYLENVKQQITNWNAVLFALYYHDIVYNTLKSNNEEKSAALAAKRMKEMGVDSTTIGKCINIILATKKHLWNEDNDINLFTDADLSILGAEWNIYKTYLKQIRKEYAIYPDMMYNPGRRKVLQHFLGMERIYKTEYFYKKLETKARQNLEQELKLLE